MSNFLKEYTRLNHGRWLANCRPFVADRLRSKEPLRYDEYEQMRMNSWERECLYPLMDHHCLISVLEDCLENCSRRFQPGPCSTYDEVVLNVLAPLLIERFKDEVRKNEERDVAESNREVSASDCRSSTPVRGITPEIVL